MQPVAGQMVQVLTFQREGRQVYTERIMAENGASSAPSRCPCRCRGQQPRSCPARAVTVGLGACRESCLAAPATFLDGG
ncbi:hypothetical protein ACTMU2_28255 [Cupriavidus basilensis]